MIDTIIENLSRTGCRLTSSVAIEIGTVVSIDIEGLDAQAARVVRSDERGQGCQFLLELTDEQVDRARVSVAAVNIAFPEMRGKVRADAAAVYLEQACLPQASRWQRILSVLR